MRPLFLRLLACCLILINTPTRAQPLPGSGGDASPPAVELFFRKPQLAGVALSPDGEHVAVLVPNPKGRVALVVAKTEGWADMKVVAAFSDADIRTVQWVNDRRLVFNLIDRQSPLGEQWGPGLWAVNLDGSNLRRLISSRDYFVREASLVQSRTLEGNHHFSHTLRDGSADVVVERLSFAARDLRQAVPLRLNTETGVTRPIVDKVPPGAHEWLVDSQGVARAVETVQDNKVTLYWRPDASADWQKVHESEGRFTRRIEPFAINDRGDLYVLARRDGKEGYGALYRFLPGEGKSEDRPLVALDGFDFQGRLVFDGQGQRLLGVHYYGDAAGSVWLDAELKALQKAVDERLPRTTNTLVCSRCESARYLVVVSTLDRVPPYYSVYDRQTGKLLPIGSTRPWLASTPMAGKEFERVPARDGLMLPTYVTKPRGKGPWPTVVLVHGGPYVRGGRWEWDEATQFLASRGYAVIETDFRGSTGYGARHFRAGFKQWGLKMQDDIADATQWAVKNGIAAPDRTCIAGASYGGYATLMGLLRYPELYRCGINWVGVTDIDLLYSISWSDMSDAWERYGMPVLLGDREKDAEQLKATSPLQQAAKIRRPILMAYGSDDRRVPIEHGLKFRDAVRPHNPDVEWVSYTGEGHGWMLLSNQVDFWSRVERFLDRHIGAGAGAGAGK